MGHHAYSAGGCDGDAVLFIPTTERTQHIVVAVHTFRIVYLSSSSFCGHRFLWQEESSLPDYARFVSRHSSCPWDTGMAPKIAVASKCRRFGHDIWRWD